MDDSIRRWRQGGDGWSLGGSMVVGTRHAFSMGETAPLGGRVTNVARTTSDPVNEAVERLLAVALRGVPAMRSSKGAPFVQTTRLSVSGELSELRREGTNPRYGAIVALGVACLDEKQQRRVLHGQTAADVASAAAVDALDSGDPGAIALAVWASAETRTLAADSSILSVLADLVATDAITATVDCAWALTALLACHQGGYGDNLTRRLADRLMAEQGENGIFPHVLLPGQLSRARRHVGCFADQVYPIQALARFYAATGDQEALAAANRCAERICTLQGPTGQWWWHYDARTGQVVEGYPVYSVHQHAMAPMALLELREAGGLDFAANISAGLRWLETHPEVEGELIAEDLGAVWRKVGRREPRKLVRSLRSISTAAHARLRLQWLDRLFPTTEIDYECRPYELGWLLYAWLAEGVVKAIKQPPNSATG